jgi:hypothetical protein
MNLWETATAAPNRPLASPQAEPPTVDSSWQTLYLRSYLWLRTLVGVLGVALPPLLILCDIGFAGWTLRVRGSLSAYYYSGMREGFVGFLIAIGVFLIAYKVVEHDLDNYLSILAGVTVVLVAVFPTQRPGGGLSGLPLTPLQDSLGEDAVGTVHTWSALVFFAALAVMSWLFGVREGKRTQQRACGTAKMTAKFWRRMHKICAALIVLAIAFIVSSKLFGWFEDYSFLVGEITAVLAFGVSWLTKGWELRFLPKAAPPVTSATSDVVSSQRDAAGDARDRAEKVAMPKS